MAQFPYSLLRGGTGVESDNPAVNLVNGARSAACGLYRNFPQGIVPSVDNPAGRAVTAPFRTMMDNMCADQGPLPLPPSRPFTGGQCPGTTYRVEYEAGVLPNPISPAQVFRLGPIGAPTFSVNAQGQTVLGFSFGSGAEAGIFSILAAGGTGSSKPDTSTWRVQNFRVSPVSGPDNCGNPGDSYPTNQPGANDYRGNRDVRGPGGIVSTPWRLPPIPVIPVGPIQFQPTLVVDIGEVKIVFDFDGATFFPIEINAPINIGGGPGSNNPNPDQNLPPGLDGEAIADRFDRLEDLIEELEKCACPEVQNLEVNQFCINVESFVQPQLPLKRNRYCAIQLTKLPQKDKTINGLDAPDVIFAGWAWFSGPGGYLSERMPIDAAGKVFKNPGNFSSFAFTLQKGALANAFELNVPLED